LEGMADVEGIGSLEGIADVEGSSEGSLEGVADGSLEGDCEGIADGTLEGMHQLASIRTSFLPTKKERRKFWPATRNQKSCSRESSRLS
jgi:hypothetical protein